MGVVVVSVRSEKYLPGKLNVYFLREGGSIDNDDDVFRFSRKNGFMAVGNDTTDYAPKAFQLPPGRYSLVAHGVDCPGVPRPGQTCGQRMSFGGGGSVSVSRPSRGYASETPSFEVVAGELTNIGDFALTQANVIRWSAIPASEVAEVMEDFSSFPQTSTPVVPDEFVLEDTTLRRLGPFSNMGRRF